MSESLNIKISDSPSKEAINKFVFENPNRSIFQTAFIAEVYRRNKGCTPLILTAINEGTGEIVASLMAKIMEEKTGFLGSFSRHSTIRGGPIFADNKNGAVATSFLLNYYNKIIGKNVLCSRIYPFNNTPQIMQSIKENGFKYGDWQNILIDLKKPKEELWSRLRRDKKRAVKKAKNSGVKVVECEDKSQISFFYDLLRETYECAKLPLQDISNFEAVFEILGSKNMAKFFLAEYEGRYIATRLDLTYGGGIYDWYAGASNEFNRLYPNDLLVWSILEWGSENGYHLFDFGGAGRPNDTSGWIEFKKGFGGKIVNYGRYTNVHTPKKLWLSKKIFRVYRKFL